VEYNVTVSKKFFYKSGMHRMAHTLFFRKGADAKATRLTSPFLEDRVFD